MKKKDFLPDMARMKQMEVGECLEFPLERLSSIKNMACVVGAETGTRLSTRVDRSNNIVEVTRRM